MPPIGGFIRVCPIQGCSFTFVYMKLISFGTDRGLHARNRAAVDSIESHGEYGIGELAYITEIADTNYVTSVGVAVRHDHIPLSVRAQRSDVTSVTD